MSQVRDAATPDGGPNHHAPNHHAPNHHAHHPGFSGLSGWLGAMSMVTGRQPIARLAADLTSVCPDDHVVDVGCGPGAAAREAARRGARVTGVDPSGVMLRTARWTSLGRRAGSVEWVEGVAESLPLDDESATVVWSLSTVHHWHDIEQGLAEAARVLAPGGRLLAVERRRDPKATGLASHGWTDEQAQVFATCCESAGFEKCEVATHELDRGIVLAVQARRPTVG